MDTLTALRGAGVGATPFNGPALAVAAYGSVFLREFDGLDLLVHRADLARAERVLAQRGYQPPAAGERDGRAWVRGDVSVVLHCALAPRWVGTRGVAGLWVRRRPIELGEARVPAPAPEDHCWC